MLKRTTYLSNKIDDPMEVTISPEEFQGIQYALQSIVRHETTTHDEHYSHIKNASEVLQRALEENRKASINLDWGNNYPQKRTITD